MHEATLKSRFTSRALDLAQGGFISSRTMRFIGGKCIRGVGVEPHDLQLAEDVLDPTTSVLAMRQIPTSRVPEEEACLHPVTQRVASFQLIWRGLPVVLFL